MPVAWSNIAVTYLVADGARFDPSDVLVKIRERAAACQGVDIGEVRIRNLCRL